MDNADLDLRCLGGSDGRVSLSLSVVPNAARTQWAGWHDGAPRVRLAAQAVDGRANAALVEWLASELGIARRDVALTHGASSRRKRLLLACPRERVLAWIAARRGGP